MPLLHTVGYVLNTNPEWIRIMIRGGFYIDVYSLIWFGKGLLTTRQFFHPQSTCYFSGEMVDTYCKLRLFGDTD